MPNPEIEKLNKASSKGQRNAAVSDCIAREIRRGRDPKQAQAMCISMANERTGEG